MPTPNFFIVGAAKCGTTAWVRYLETHPDIYFSELKEPQYFAPDLPGIQRIKSARDYANLFRPAKDEPIVAEASAMYLYSRTAAEAIRQYRPDARILIFLRDQEEFLQSLHHQYLYAFQENIEDFGTAWHLSGNRPADRIPNTCTEPRLLDYAAVGDFREQVERFTEAFPAEQIHVVHFRDWTADPRAAYLQILDFLGLEDDGRIDFPRVNAAKTHGRKWLGRLIYHPPAFVHSLVALLKKVLRRPKLGLGAWAVSRIAVPGYRTNLPDQMREEIRRCYAKDNGALNDRLALLGSSCRLPAS